MFAPSFPHYKPGHRSVVKQKLELEEKMRKMSPVVLTRAAKVNFSSPSNFQRANFALSNSNLGSGGLVAGIVGIASVGAQTATTIYGIKQQSKLDKKRLEIEAELARRKMSLEEQLASVQKRILDIQASGMEKTQELSLDVMKARAELEKAKLDFELEQIKRQQERMRLERELEEERISIEKAYLDRIRSQKEYLQREDTKSLDTLLAEIKEKENRVKMLEAKQREPQLPFPKKYTYLGGGFVLFILLMILMTRRK
ncbi:MAG TPA: hypothetical protein ENF45_01235 [Bacteroidetes bacterium]|nr:hypothetical protein [Bacteroidota bacterium]